MAERSDPPPAEARFVDAPSPAVGTQDRSSFAWVAGVVLLVVASGAYYIWRTSMQLGGEHVFVLWDDGMISMQFAKNFVAGHGFVWSVDETPIQGFSNLGVTLIMSLVHLFPIPPRLTSLALQLLNLGALVGMVVLGQRLLKLEFGPSRWMGLAGALSVALCFPMTIFSLQGSDTGFVGLWLMICLWLLRTEAETNPWSPRLFFVLGIGLVLRLDSAILIIPFLAVASLTMIFSSGRYFRNLVVAALILGGYSAGILIFQFLYFGDIFPNTYYLKATGQPRAAMLLNGVRQLLILLPYWIPALLLAAWATTRYRLRPLVQVMAGCFLMGLAYHVWVGGDLQPKYASRFLIPGLPLLLMLAAVGIRDGIARFDSLPRKGFTREGLAIVLLVAVALITNGPSANQEILSGHHDTLLKRYNQRNLASAYFFRANTEPDTTIALHWAGLISYFADRPVRDVLGKCDPYIARLEVERFMPGHSKWDWDYVVNEVEPEIINMASRGLNQRADFKERYLHAQPQGAPHFFVRRDRAESFRAKGVRLTSLQSDGGGGG